MVVFVVLGGVAVAQTDEPDLASIDATLINVSRAQSGLAPLAVDARLQAIAQQHAWGMAKHRVMKHNLRLGKEVRRSGMCWRLVGENILEPRYRLIGVGVVRRRGTIWNVEDFAEPC